MQKIVLYLILTNQILFAQDFVYLSFEHQIKKSLYNFSNTILIWPFKNVNPNLEYWEEIIKYDKYLNGTNKNIKIPIDKQKHTLKKGKASILSYEMFGNEKFNRFSIDQSEAKPQNNYGDGFLDFTEINNDIKTYLRQQGVNEEKIQTKKFILKDYNYGTRLPMKVPYEHQSSKKYYERFVVNKSTTIERYNNNIQIEYNKYTINFPMRRSTTEHGINRQNHATVPFNNTPDIYPYTEGRDNQGSFPYVHVRFFIRKKP